MTATSPDPELDAFFDGGTPIRFAIDRLGNTTPFEPRNTQLDGGVVYAVRLPEGRKEVRAHGRQSRYLYIGRSVSAARPKGIASLDHSVAGALRLWAWGLGDAGAALEVVVKASCIPELDEAWLISVYSLRTCELGPPLNRKWEGWPSERLLRHLGRELFARDEWAVDRLSEPDMSTLARRSSFVGIGSVSWLKVTDLRCARWAASLVYGWRRDMHGQSTLTLVVPVPPPKLPLRDASAFVPGRFEGTHALARWDASPLDWYGLPEARRWSAMVERVHAALGKPRAGDPITTLQAVLDASLTPLPWP